MLVSCINENIIPLDDEMSDNESVFSIVSYPIEENNIMEESYLESIGSFVEEFGYKELFNTGNYTLKKYDKEDDFMKEIEGYGCYLEDRFNFTCMNESIPLRKYDIIPRQPYVHTWK